jgi:4-hydroxy-tetrahydrodipicolinate synthase
MFTGSMVALVTPFRQNKVDETKLQELVQWHCNSGTSGILVCGSTGEGGLLSQDERNRITILAQEAASGKVPIIVGVPTNVTHEAIDMVQHAQKLKADGVLVVTPFYLKPSQEGIYQHFKTVHDATDIPIISYNNPGRVIVEQSIDLVLRLAELPRVVGLKDSTNDMSRPALLRPKLPKKISLLGGDDPLAASYLANGGDGFMSVTANVVPHLMAQFYNSWRMGEGQAFDALNQKLMPLHQALFCETNPCPVKYAVSVVRGTENSLRLPLLPISKTHEEKVLNTIQSIQ